MFCLSGFIPLKSKKNKFLIIPFSNRDMVPETKDSFK